MIQAVLQRLRTGDSGTFGLLRIVGGPSWFSGELPWRDNAHDVSCIPPGVYQCGMTYSPRFRRKLYAVEGVPDRQGIRIHPANLMGDAAKGLKCQLNGCIALGKKCGTIEGQSAVLLSMPALSELQTATKGQPFTLEIRE